MDNFAAAILSYNHPEHTAHCIHSALKFIAADKIFLMHNGSLQQHVNTLKNQFPQIRHIVIPINKGFTGGANALLQSVFFEHNSVLFLTNDTELTAVSTTFMNQLKNKDLFFSSIKLMKRNSQGIDSVLGTLNPRNGQLSHLKNADEQSKQPITYIPGTAFWLSKKYLSAGYLHFDYDVFNNRF